MSASQPLPESAASNQRYLVDREQVAPHDPQLYAHDAVAEPLPDLDAIGQRELEVYHSQGFLAVEKAFSDEQVEAARQGMVDLVMGRNPDFEGIQFEAAAADRLEQLDISQRLDAMRKLQYFVNYDDRLKALAEYRPLLTIIERLMGGRESYMFQDMGLSKPPQIGREKPWHQDCAYFNLPLDTPVVGVWIALDEATLENGCMRLMAGGHHEGPIPHWRRRDWQICDTDIEKLRDEDRPIVAVPLKPGGLLLFNGMTPHGTPHNHSGQRRRAVQYHYRPADVTPVSKEQRLAVWGTEGKDVQC